MVNKSPLSPTIEEIKEQAALGLTVNQISRKFKLTSDQLIRRRITKETELLAVLKANGKLRQGAGKHE